MLNTNFFPWYEKGQGKMVRGRVTSPADARIQCPNGLMSDRKGRGATPLDEPPDGGNEECGHEGRQDFTCPGWFGHGVLLVDESVDFLGDLEIEIGETTLAMRGELEAHLAFADVDVGVVFVFLGDFGDAVDEFNRLRKVVEFKGPFDGLFIEIPFGKFLHPVFDVLGAKQIGHGVSLGLGLGFGWVALALGLSNAKWQRKFRPAVALRGSFVQRGFRGNPTLPVNISGARKILP